MTKFPGCGLCFKLMMFDIAHQGPDYKNTNTKYQSCKTWGFAIQAEVSLIQEIRSLSLYELAINSKDQAAHLDCFIELRRHQQFNWARCKFCVKW